MKKPKIDLKLEELSAFMDKLPKIVDAIVYGGVAYAGYEIFEDWKGALFAVVSLKLAQAPGGSPPVSQVAGVAGLSMLGLATMTNTLKNPSNSLEDALAGAGVPRENIEEWKKKNKNYLDFLDKVNTVQQVLPTGGLWNIMWRIFEQIT